MGSIPSPPVGRLGDTYLDCRHCGKIVRRPRKRQQCCSKSCRVAYERTKRQIASQHPPHTVAGRCPWCDAPFRSAKAGQRFCSAAHQQAFNNHWKGKGPAIALAMIDWRVGRKPGALSKVCRTFADARAEQKRKGKPT